MTLQSIILTLQYCLETFEASCSCGHCDACTRGQNDIREAIQLLEILMQRNKALTADAPSVRYALARADIRIEFFDRPSLIQFIRESMPAGSIFSDDPTNTEVATIAAARRYTLIEYQPGECLQVSVLLKLALNTLQDLLLTTELNMDNLEPETRQALLRAADFENLAALHGFLHDETDSALRAGLST
jgi:hypothetical protein